MKRTAVLNVVGLVKSLIGEATPHLRAFAGRSTVSTILPAFPAVTCTAQSNYLTGREPSQHGVVGNGWYDRSLAEVQFWKQSNHLVSGEKIWDDLKKNDPRFTCAVLFWWYNMYSTADYSITPRPIYRADGSKIFDIHSWPYSIRPEIKASLGEFPFTSFWGPTAGVKGPQGGADAASRWIAQSARWIEERHQPDLNLVYLPHLDYNLQRLGPGDERIRTDLQEIDAIVGELIRFFESRSVQVVILSEYGIGPVRTAVHPNRILREQGWLAVKDELGLELLDAGASRVFAVSDHQVAHIYLNDSGLEAKVRSLLESQPGVERVLDRKEKAALGIDHPRAGDLVAVAKPEAWFTYYYWMEEGRAPDFARTVDIHRKPGYDPVELFLDPGIPAVKLKILWRLLQKKAGCRALIDVIPLDAGLVKGSHGRRPTDPREFPVLLSGRRDLSIEPELVSTGIYGILKRHLLD